MPSSETFMWPSASLVIEGVWAKKKCPIQNLRVEQLLMWVHCASLHERAPRDEALCGRQMRPRIECVARDRPS